MLKVHTSNSALVQLNYTMETHQHHGLETKILEVKSGIQKY